MSKTIRPPSKGGASHADLLGGDLGLRLWIYDNRDEQSIDNLGSCFITDNEYVRRPGSNTVAISTWREEK